MRDPGMYYEDARGMFMQPGWETFTREIEERIDLLDLDSVNSTEELWFAKGQLAALRAILAYEDQVKHEEKEFDGRPQATIN